MRAAEGGPGLLGRWWAGGDGDGWPSGRSPRTAAIHCSHGGGGLATLGCPRGGWFSGGGAAVVDGLVGGGRRPRWTDAGFWWWTGRAAGEGGGQWPSNGWSVDLVDRMVVVESLNGSRM